MKKKVVELTKTELDRAIEVYKKSIFVNCLDGTPPDNAVNYFEKLAKGGVTAINWTIFAHPRWNVPNRGSAREGSNRDFAFREMIDSIKERWLLLEEAADSAFQCYTVNDILKAKKEGKLAVIFGTQNGTFIEDDASLLSLFKKMGLRIMQLTYQDRNLIGDGCGEKADGGLSRFGFKVVEEMNKLGVVVDLSHCGHSTTMDAIEASKDPVIFSHSNARALFDHVRNKTDEELKALAEKDGVIGTVDWIVIVNGAKPGTTIENYLDHVDYIADLIGVKHIGIGNDHVESPKRTREGTYEGYLRWPEIYQVGPFDEQWPLEKRYAGIYPYAEKSLEYCKGLVARGYSDQEIEKIMGGNFLRVFKRVWKN